MNTEEVKKIIAGFGPRLRKYLLKEKITDQAFAQKLGRSRGIGHYESNPGILPKTSMIVALAEQFPHWSLDYIVKGEGEMYKGSTSNQEVNEPDISYHRNLLYWLALQEDVKADIKVLPIDGFQQRYEQLKQELTELHAENIALLGSLKDK